MKIKKAVVRAILPISLFERLQAIRSRRVLVRSLKRNGMLEAAARYAKRNGCTVRHGPFAGLIYSLKVAQSCHSIPKLLGTYEQELHGVIDLIGRRKYDLVIDIGSAEGYYAIGLARLLGTKVLAYEPEPVERAACSELAQINGVEAIVELKSLFLPSDIDRYRDLRVLCICDCEGFEAQLFDADSVKGLGQWDLLIELHGSTVQHLPSLTWPHKTATYVSLERSEALSELEGVGDYRKLLSEGRHGSQTWLWCDSQIQHPAA